MTLFQLYIVLIILVFALGFGIGRRTGRKAGFREGLGLAPLELRRVSLEKGTCQICGTGVTKQDENGIIIDIKESDSY